MTETTATTILRTSEEVDDWTETAEAFAFAVNDDGPWIIYSAEDGDWYALRPLNEDDIHGGVAQPRNSTSAGIGPIARLHSLDDVTLPLRIIATTETTRAAR